MSKSAEALLIDMDGVLYQNGRLIEGARETLVWLKQASIRHMFLTNTTSLSRKSLQRKYFKLGLEIDSENLLTPAYAANQLCQQINLRRVALFVEGDCADDFDAVESVSIERTSKVDAIVIGDLGKEWNYPRLNTAFRFLMQQPTPRLIALGMTRYWQAADGLSLDVGPFVRMLEFAASHTAIVVGKPAPDFFAAALGRLGVAASNTYMIGDDIEGDIDAGQQCGIRGIQVKTGKFRPADLERGIKPYLLLESVAALRHWWELQR